MPRFADGPVSIALVAAFLVGCGGASEPEAPPSSAAVAPEASPEVERARELAATFKERLLGELRGALADGGPKHAIGVCAERAPAIAAELSVDGVEIGRASHKTRNPANAPEGWLVPVVEAYVASDGDGGPTRVDLPGGRVGWAEPLQVGPPCLACHGPDVDPALLETIRETYPEDEAIGFEPGSFRGVLWVTVPASGDAPGV